MNEWSHKRPLKLYEKKVYAGHIQQEQSLEFASMQLT
jgi:hypothetical protein